MKRAKKEEKKKKMLRKKNEGVHNLHGNIPTLFLGDPINNVALAAESLNAT